MVNQKIMKSKWDKIVSILSKRFNDGQVLEIEAIIYLIGIQELGKT